MKNLGLEVSLRDAITGEFNAIQQYEEIAQFYSENEDVRKTLIDIANEERVHVGELQALYGKVFPENQKFVEEGEKEFNESNKISKAIEKVATYLQFEVFYNEKDNVIECEMEIGNCSYSLLQSKVEEFRKLVDKEITKAYKLKLNEDFMLSCDSKRIWIIDGKLNYSIMGLKKDLNYSFDLKPYGYDKK